MAQFISANEASYKAAGRKLTTRYDTFYGTPCAAHCIDLILEDLAKPDLFPLNAFTIENARKIMKFIYNHSWVLNALRKDFTGGRDLFRPGITRFATNFISLQSLFMFKGELQKMFTSDLWVNSSYFTSPIGLDISDLLLDSSFWRNVEHILNLSEPLVRVLRFVGQGSSPC